jgi:fucose permease
VAVAGFFFVHGTLLATWVSRIPAVKEGTGLTDARLGLALLAMGIGLCAGLAPTSWLIARVGTAQVMVGSALGACALLPGVGAARSLAALAPALVGYGAMLGALDVSMNAEATWLEQRFGRSIMSSFHALWSLGGLVGATVGGALAAREVRPLVQFACVCAALAALAITGRAALGQVDDDRLVRAPLVWPSREVIAIGTVTACAAIVEGGVADWSGVYLRDVLGSGPGMAAGAFAAFSMAMMIGRLAGDRLIDRFGGRAMLRTGALFAALAIGAAIVGHHALGAVAAFAIVGASMSTAFPLAFSAAGRASGGEVSQAIATVATMGYGASLLGPPLIGFAAGAISLRWALGLPLAAAVAIVVLAGRLRSLPGRAPAFGRRV